MFERTLVRLRSLRGTVAAATVLAAALVALAAPADAAHHAPKPQTSTSTSAGAINGLARVPYMGWNTYYGLGGAINEQVIKDEANAIVDRGLKAAGYQYVWLDGGWWSGTRDALGQITVDSQQWPDGMKAVAAYIHSKGLKAGIYTDVGIDGCGGARQGSYGHYQQDANTFASWGYDAVKVDFCGGEKMGLDPATQYGQFRDALLANSSHRPMLFNICNPFVPETGAPAGKSAYGSWKFGPKTGNAWRTDTDIGFYRNVQYRDMLRNLDHDAMHPEAAGPGHWNDPDYLAPELGFTNDEAQTQFSMWSVLAAPLIIGSDVKSLSQSTIDMLTNREVLAIDQDPLGRQGTAVSTDGALQVWVKPLVNGDRAVALFNRGETAATISTTTRVVGIPKSAAYALRNVWTHTTTESRGTISAAVKPHSVVLFRVSPKNHPGTTAPNVTLSPVTSPAPYPGSQLRLAVPGKTFTVTSALQNDGRRRIDHATVTLDLPAGWTATPSATTQVGRLRGGQLTSLSWTAAVPASARPGTVPLRVTASYQWRSGGEAYSETTTTEADVQVPPPPPAGTANLAHQTWLRATSGWMTPQVDGSVGGGPMRMNGTSYPTGIGVASPSTIEYYVGGRCSSLTATIGIDDATNFDPAGGTAVFQVLGDGRVLYDSGLISRPTTKQVSVPLGSADVLTLQVNDGGDGGYNDRADWAALQVQCAPAG